MSACLHACILGICALFYLFSLLIFHCFLSSLHFVVFFCTSKSPYLVVSHSLTLIHLSSFFFLNSQGESACIRSYWNGMGNMAFHIIFSFLSLVFVCLCFCGHCFHLAYPEASPPPLVSCFGSWAIFCLNGAGREKTRAMFHTDFLGAYYYMFGRMAKWKKIPIVLFFLSLLFPFRFLFAFIQQFFVSFVPDFHYVSPSLPLMAMIFPYLFCTVSLFAMKTRKKKKLVVCLPMWFPSAGLDFFCHVKWCLFAKCPWIQSLMYVGVHGEYGEVK